MNQKQNIYIFVCMSLISLTRAIVFTRCELVKELTINGLPEDQLPDCKYKINYFSGKC